MKADKKRNKHSVASISAMLMFGLSMTTCLAGALDAKRAFKIPPQALSSALLTLSTQANIQIMTASADIANLKSVGVSGQRTTLEALGVLLEGTGLKFRVVSENAIAIEHGTSKPSVVPKPLAYQDIGTHLAQAVAVLDEAEVGTKKEKEAVKVKNDGVEEMIVEKGRIKPFSDANVDIPRTINDPQPYYIFDSETIERSAAVNIEDFLKQRLTMNTVFQTSAQVHGISSNPDNSAIPGSNNSAINLRGLGIDKTLILVNGRRVAGVNYSRGNEMRTYQADLNGIPLAAVDRIEVLPSSASAIYGGSAMGGVVNVILKKSYQGGEVRYTYDMPSNSSASTSTADAMYGLSFEGGKSHLTATAHYSTAKPMLFRDRIEFFWRGVDRVLRTGGVSSLYDIFDGRMGVETNMYGVNASGARVNIVLDDGTDLGTPYAHIAPGSTSSTPMAQRFVTGWNFEPSDGYGAYGLRQPLGTPSEVKSFSAAFTRHMTSRLDMFVDAAFNQNDGDTMYDARSSAQTSIRSTYPWSPFQTPTVYVISGKGIVWPLHSSSQTSNMTLGFKANFPGDWTGETDYTLSKNKFEHDYADSDTLNPATREQRLDVLVDPNYVDLSKYFVFQPYEGNSRIDDFAVRFAGPLVRLPWGSPTLSFGLQRTKASIPASTRDSNSGLELAVPGDITKATTTYYARSQTSDAFYVEGMIPLITEKNSLPLLRGLDLQMAHRTSRYIAETGTLSMVEYNSVPPLYAYSPTPLDAVGGLGGTPRTTYASYGNQNQTFGIKYKPTGSIALRASVATAFLPPSYSQLIPDQTIRRLAGRVNTSTGFYMVDTISGGNPNLKPQSSRNFDAGLIIEPQGGAFKGLRLNFEYYKIGQYDFISSLSIAQILSDPQLTAARVTRDPLSGLITLVDTSLGNINEYSTSGVDLSLNYTKPTSIGTFDFHIVGTQINYERRQLVLNGAFKDYVGYPSAGGPVQHKANASMSWGRRQWVLGWSTTWSGNYRVSGSPGDPNYATPAYYYVNMQGSFSIPSQMYHQMFASYTFDKGSRLKMLSDLTLRLNISNVFNTIPAYEASQFPFFFSPLGDVRLRAYNLMVKKAF